MQLLSIDVGIKNLALCVIEPSTCSIIKWEIVDISQSDSFQCDIALCNTSVCFHHHSTDKYYCRKHAKKHVPKNCHLPKHLTNAELKKLYVHDLRQLVDDMQSVNPPIQRTKKALLEWIHTYKCQHYLEEIQPAKASTVDLISISQNITSKLNVFLEDVSVEHIIIENQMGKIATRMKTVEGMLIQYFTMTLPLLQKIETVSATNKLKGLNLSNEKTTYSQRKKLSIEKCLEFLQSSLYDNIHYIDYFQQHQKKDDLSDSLLQGLRFIRTTFSK
jgi:hypothetical protein